MHFVLVDDSISFDGFTASARAIGGQEKLFAALAGALVRRGHTVNVFNRCQWPMLVEGAQWETFDGKKPLTCDVLVALRRPELLGFIRTAKTRVFWPSTPGRFMSKGDAAQQIANFKPHVMLNSAAQAQGLVAKDLKLALTPRVVKQDFINAKPRQTPRPPVAVVTTHPAHNMDWLLNLWPRIRAEVTDAQLHIYSTTLWNSQNGKDIDNRFEAIAAKVKAMKDLGVEILRPKSDPLMAEFYASARVHLWPGHVDDVTAFGLADSQAAGCPAVLRPLGAAAERVTNGETAYVVPDDDAFANLAALLLRDADVAENLGRNAKAAYAEATIDAFAAALENFAS